MRGIRVSIIRASALVLTAGAALLSEPAQARSVIQVPADYPTIQAAITAASPGDTIQVAAGVYCEQLLISTADLRLHGTAAAGAHRVVLDGSCLLGVTTGIHVAGTAEAPLSGVEIAGFVLQGYRTGIYLHNATGSRIHQNEVRNSGVNAIVLFMSSFNDVSQNDLHDNGHLGIGLQGASDGNVVRGNRLSNNNTGAPLGGCNLMAWNGASGNWIVENEILGPNGTGIMLGPDPALATRVTSGNYVRQNRVHGLAGPGIIIMPAATGNVVEQNNATGNGAAEAYPSLPLNVDLLDFTVPTDNTWNRNLGTCVPGSGVC